MDTKLTGIDKIIFQNLIETHDGHAGTAQVLNTRMSDTLCLKRYGKIPSDMTEEELKTSHSAKWSTKFSMIRRALLRELPTRKGYRDEVEELFQQFPFDAVMSRVRRATTYELYYSRKYVVFNDSTLTEKFRKINPLPDWFSDFKEPQGLTATTKNNQAISRHNRLRTDGVTKLDANTAREIVRIATQKLLDCDLDFRTLVDLNKGRIGWSHWQQGLVCSIQVLTGARASEGAKTLEIEQVPDRPFQCRVRGVLKKRTRLDNVKSEVYTIPILCEFRILQHALSVLRASDKHHPTSSLTRPRKNAMQDLFGEICPFALDHRHIRALFAALVFRDRAINHFAEGTSDRLEHGRAALRHTDDLAILSYDFLDIEP